MKTKFINDLYTAKNIVVGTVMQDLNSINNAWGAIYSNYELLSESSKPINSADFNTFGFLRYNSNSSDNYKLIQKLNPFWFTSSSSGASAVGAGATTSGGAITYQKSYNLNGKKSFKKFKKSLKKLL